MLIILSRCNVGMKLRFEIVHCSSHVFILIHGYRKADVSVQFFLSVTEFGIPNLSCPNSVNFCPGSINFKLLPFYAQD